MTPNPITPHTPTLATLRKYGLSEGDFFMILAHQGGVCRFVRGIIDFAETGNARILLYNTNTPVNHLRPVRQSQQLLVDGCIALRSN